MQKKIALTVALATVLGLAGWQYAQANPGGSGGRPCWQQQGQNVLDEAGQKKQEQFLADTKELRKSMVVKQAEKMALMQAEKPDAAKVAALAGDLFELRNQIRAKAVEAGVGPGWMAMGGGPGGGCGPCDGHGPRQGMGHGMGYWN